MENTAEEYWMGADAEFMAGETNLEGAPGKKLCYEGVLVMYCHDGTASVRLNGITHQLRPGLGMSLLWAHEVAVQTVSPDFRASYFTLDAALAHEMWLRMHSSIIMDFCQAPLYETESRWHPSLARWYAEAAYVATLPPSAQRRAMMLSLLDYSCRSFEESLMRQAATGIKEGGTPMALPLRFVKLVVDDFHDHHDVNYYASRLCVSPNHLRKVISSYFRRSPKEIVEQHLFVSVMDSLRHTDLPMLDIAERHGFGDASSLSRFFKRHAGGQSPLQWRIAANKC